MHTRGQTDETANFSANTYFHLYNRGVENRILFSSQEDFDRFEAYLYLLNAVEGQRAANFFAGSRADNIFSSARGERLVSFAAYSITPREYHLLVTPLFERGISKLMQKLQTAYTMYFNKKYQRAGRLFQSAYRAQRAESVEHLKHLFAFVHLHPVVLFSTDFFEHERASEESPALVSKALQYRYSSIREYQSGAHVITNPEAFPKYVQRLKKGSALMSAFDRTLLGK